MTDTVAAFPLELQIWLSPAFPVGSFAYSHGLEWAAGTGRVHDRATAAAWLGDLLAHGAPRNDAILLAHAWRAAPPAAGSLRSLNELALAMAGSRERHLETAAQGNAFLTMVLATWSSPHLAAARDALPGDVAYPIAVGCAAAAHAIPLQPTLACFLTSVANNVVSALVRLSVVGQTDGQRIMAALVPAIGIAARAAAGACIDDLASATFVSDIAAMAHETQETRLFRS